MIWYQVTWGEFSTVGQSRRPTNFLERVLLCCGCFLCYITDAAASFSLSDLPPQLFTFLCQVCRLPWLPWLPCCVCRLVMLSLYHVTYHYVTCDIIITLFSILSIIHHDCIMYFIACIITTLNIMLCCRCDGVISNPQRILVMSTTTLCTTTWTVLSTIGL